MPPRLLRFTLLATCGSAALVSAQPAPPSRVATAFREWARVEAKPLRLGDGDTTDARLGDLAAIGAMVGEARIIATSEPFHGGHEPLLMRNRLAMYCVLRLRCTGIVLESGIAQSKRLDDYVRGNAADDDTTDAALGRSFSWGFGQLRENLALLHWLRQYNATRPERARVGIYGMDLSGIEFQPRAPSVTAALGFLDRASPPLGAAARRAFPGLDSLLASVVFPEHDDADRDRVSAQVLELTSFMRDRRIALTAAVGGREYAWALQLATAAQQDLAYLRRMNKGLLPRLMAGVESLTVADSVREVGVRREVAMADNVQWILAQQPPSGRVLVFAHFTHVQQAPMISEGAHPVLQATNGLEPMGMYMRALFGRSLFVIGTYFGTAAPGAAPFPPAKPLDSAGIEGLLASRTGGAYAADLRRLPARGSLRDFFAREHRRRGGNFGDALLRSVPIAVSDALLFFPYITPAHTVRGR